MTASGGSAEFKVYPETFHVFDGSAKPVWSANQEVYGACNNERINRTFSVRLDTGAALRTKKDWDQFFAGCVKRGSLGWRQPGGHPPARSGLGLPWSDHGDGLVG